VFARAPVGEPPRVTAGARHPAGPGPAPTGAAPGPGGGPARPAGRIRGVAGLLGPAFVAAVAYVDPGNVATNVSAGADYGYTLVWVVVAANLMAMVVQYQSAKLGVVTGRDLAELCRDTYPRGVSIGLWVQAEIVAMATDIAEFVGAAIGLYLLFGIPLFPAGVITAVVAFGVLALEQRGHRRFELAVVALLALVLLGTAYDLVALGVHWPAVADGLVPRFSGPSSVTLAAGIVGATVMPHVVYLHSALTKKRLPRRDDGERRAALRVQRIDVLGALGVAGVVNVAMLVVAASLAAHSGAGPGDPIEAAHAGLGRVAGGAAAMAFAVALLASGLSSSSVGTYAGQVVMQGFIHRRIPVFARRAVTMLPALAVLALGLPVTATLVFSQVVLSFGIPFALVPLTLLTRRVDVMGPLANSLRVTVLLAAVAGTIVALNVYLLVSAALHR
jgi:manganese transport protein